MTVASSASRLLLASFSRESSDLGVCAVAELDEDSANSCERVLCSPGTCNDSAAALRRSLNDRDVAVFRSDGRPRRLDSTDFGDGRSSDIRRGDMGGGVIGRGDGEGEGGRRKSSFSDVLTVCCV